jgi:hypothetical protein
MHTVMVTSSYFYCLMQDRITYYNYMPIKYKHNLVSKIGWTLSIGRDLNGAFSQN